MDKKEITTEELKELKKHQEVILDLQLILNTKHGRNFVKYLFESFDVASELPPIGCDEAFIRDRLGFLRAGNSIFKLAAQANPEVAGTLLGQIEKEKYETLLYDSRRE